ncbi:hypothetical protein MTR_5g034570 [Medicago truncatula]|uniref:Uncharacterized protein n=1 Tax=Medicago truncatula TaxID=3880 RepID=A0A072UDR5_MEDTR|nr:hypothetical protein MTR_5g034570 [Medicago truncatula]
MANAGPDSGNMISGLIARADDEISRVIVRIADSIAHRFRKSNADPNRDIPHSLAPASADAEIPPSVNLTDEEIIDRFVILAYEPMVRSTVIFGGCYVAFEWINKGYLLDLISMIQICEALLATIAAQLEQKNPSDRCRSLSRYNYSRTSHFRQGLKSIKKTYIQQTAVTGFRQEVEQHQEGTSRAVVPSSRSTGKEKQIKRCEVCSRVDNGK